MRISDWSSDVCSSDLAAVALVGLGHQPVAAAQARVCAGGEQLAADDEGRVEPAFGQHAGQQRGGGGLAVGAGDRDAAAEAHQLGRKSGVWGKSVAVSVDLGGRRELINKKNKNKKS